jgi:hypothetical protein
MIALRNKGFEIPTPTEQVSIATHHNSPDRGIFIALQDGVHQIPGELQVD